MNLPKKDKQARINDIHKMLLPEMMPDQLQLLGLCEADIGDGSYAQTRAHKAAGIELVKLLHKRARGIKASQNDLYADRATHSQPSQLDLVLDNSDIFMQQVKALLNLLPPHGPDNEPIYKLVDQLVETSIQIGYSAGSNDSLALTDRYTNSGYTSKVTKPQNGGKTKAQAIDPVKALVSDMANHIYQHQDLLSASKAMLAGAIHSRLVEFSASGDNRNIPALQHFTNRAPEHDTIEGWLKPITKPEVISKPPRPSRSRLIDELKTAYKPQVIKKHLKA